MICPRRSFNFPRWLPIPSLYPFPSILENIQTLDNENVVIVILVKYKLREFSGSTKLLIDSRSVTAHKEPGTRGLVEKAHASLENRTN